MAYDVGVRSYLTGKGVENSDIDYDKNTGNVTIKKQPFYKPELNMSGSTYSSQQNLDNAYSTYSKSLQPTASAGNVLSGAVAGGATGVLGVGTPKQAPTETPKADVYTNPYVAQYQDIMKRLEESNKAMQQPVDIYGTPEYAAAKAQQDKASHQSTRQAQESMGASGFGRSTNLQDRAQGIQNEANDYLQTQLVPQIQNALQNKNQQQYNNLLSQFNTIYQMVNQADNQHQNEISNANADRNFAAGRQDAATAATGIYNPSGLSYEDVQAQMDRNSKAYGSATPQEQQRLHDENIQLGSQLGKTYDPKTGTYSKGNGYVGIKTLAAQQIEQALATGELDQKMAEYNYQQLKDPNSAVNQISNLDLQIKKLEAENLPERQKLELQQLRKQIAEIGVVHYKPQSTAEIAQDKVTLALANKQLDDISKGIYPGDKPPSGNYDKDINRIAGLYITPGSNGVAPAVSNPQAMKDAIIALGMDDAETDRYLVMYGLPIN